MFAFVEKLFSNPGKFIKRCAVITFFIEIILTIIAIGLILLALFYSFFSNLFYLYYFFDQLSVYLGLSLSLVIALIAEFFSCVFIYAFGELVENSTVSKQTLLYFKDTLSKNQPQPTTSNNSTDQKQTNEAPKAASASSSDSNDHPTVKASTLSELYCPNCKEELSFMGWTENDLKTEQTCPYCYQTISLTNANESSDKPLNFGNNIDLSKVDTINNTSKTWECKKCGSKNPVSSVSCKDCGTYK